MGINKAYIQKMLEKESSEKYVYKVLAKYLLYVCQKLQAEHFCSLILAFIALMCPNY